MLKLYVHPFSTPALTAEMTAHAVGAEFEKHIVDLTSGEQRSESYLAINAKGKVPALVDGDTIVCESLTIQRYLAKRQGSDLYPRDIKDQAQVEEWMDYAAQHVRAPMSRIQFNRMVAPMLGQPVDENSIKVGEHLLAQSLPQIDTQLSKTEFLTGNQLRLCDITTLVALDPCEALKIDLTPYPYLTRWRQALRERDFYQNVHTHFGAELGL